MPKPSLKFEKLHEGVVAGVDEAGRGPWAGPMIAAAVILPGKGIPKGINDSKQMTPESREALYELIITRCETGVGIATVGEIDTLNILQATMLAMQRAVGMLARMPHVALIDGNRAPKLSCNCETIVEGDAKSLSIAAASIVAKVTRDRLMKELAREFPGYGWESNAGYGTPAHRGGMSALGLTPHHRRSFAPVRAFLEATDLFETKLQFDLFDVA